MAKNGIIKTASIVAGLVGLVIVGLVLFVWGNIALNSFRLKSSSPITHYLLNLETKKHSDITQFFEQSAPKAEVLAILSKQNYTPRSMHGVLPGHELMPNEYAFKRIQISQGFVSYKNTYLRVQFDESDRLVSAKGSRSNGYW